MKLVKDIFKSRSPHGWGHYRLLQSCERPFELKFRLYDLPAALRKEGGESFRFFLIGVFEGFLRAVIETPLRHVESTASLSARFYEFHFVSA